jgi:hypothetical protein
MGRQNRPACKSRKLAPVSPGNHRIYKHTGHAGPHSPNSLRQLHVSRKLHPTSARIVSGALPSKRLFAKMYEVRRSCFMRSIKSRKAWRPSGFSS